MDFQQAGTGNNNESNIDMVVRGIRQGIATKKYLPGMKVKEAELCRDFSVSRTPVREAFRLLQNEGILTYMPHRGVQVAQFSEKNFFDNLELRSVIEVFSARRAAEKATEEQIREARKINERIRIYNPDDPVNTTELDMEFHMCIARMGENGYIADTLDRLFNSQVLVRVFLPFRERRVTHTYKEHCDILNAIEAHEAEIAAKYMEIHFLKSIESNHRKIAEIAQEQTKGTKTRRAHQEEGVPDTAKKETEQK